MPEGIHAQLSEILRKLPNSGATDKSNCRFKLTYQAPASVRLDTGLVLFNKSRLSRKNFKKRSKLSSSSNRWQLVCTVNHTGGYPTRPCRSAWRGACAHLASRPEHPRAAPIQSSADTPEYFICMAPGCLNSGFWIAYLPWLEPA